MSYGELKDKLVNGNRIAKFRVLMASAFKPYTSRDKCQEF